jgi:predicted ATPase/class 3 adenylate cyclase
MRYNSEHKRIYSARQPYISLACTDHARVEHKRLVANMVQHLDLSPEELAAALRDYLPSALERQCLLGNVIRDLLPCAQHLAALLHAVCTYLPRQVVVPLLQDPEPGKVEGGFTRGTVMFADISGFTAMSEKLSQLGKEGAEEITSIVNRFFSALLEVTAHYGGDLLKFGGDALLVFFGGSNHALRACQAAVQMQATMSRFSQTTTSQGVFRLRMTIGLGTGSLFMAKLGSNEGGSGSMEFAVMGPAMAQMAQAEDLAEASEIYIDTDTRDDIRHAQAITGKTQDGFTQLVDIRAPEESTADSLTVLPPIPPADDLLPWIARTVQRIRALELFLPPGLMDKIKLEPERIAIGGEYRPVTVLFANFYGIDEIIQDLGEARSAELTAILNAHFTTMRRIIAKYGGVVNKVDSYAVGHRIMALFGAPRAHIDDPERAVRAAIEMQEAMTGFAELSTSCGMYCLKQRIGVNTGLVFAGNVGSLTRQEYSVMGDEVNLTARLMAVASEGQVLASQSTAREVGGALLLHEQEPVKVKGKSQPVHNYAVLGLQQVRQSPRERRPLIGRDQEWNQIHSLTDLAMSGDPQVLTIVGDVGLGKSRLLQEISSHWNEEHGALSISATCPSFGRHTPYLPWLDVLRALFGLNPADSDQVRLDKIAALLQEIEPAWRDWTILVGQLLGLNVQESDLVRSLDAQSRQRTIFRIVANLVSYVAQEQPLLLTIDDLQWADDTSVELANHVARRTGQCPLFLVLAHRPEESLTLDLGDLPHHTSLRLQELSDAAGLRLLDALLPTTPQMPAPLKRLILEKARGNPLFIEAVAHTLIENYLSLDEETGAYHARADLEQIQVPDSVNRVIMSRIDRLDESSRNVLRVASVIGQEFAHWLLSAIYPYRRGEGELVERLNELSQRELLQGPLSDLIYLFRHILTREVAYESLLYADRRQLHRRIGGSIEAQRKGQLTEYWEVLAYHFALAEEWDKALHYHLAAGRKAQDMYANEDAIHHYRQALDAAEQVLDSQDRQLVAHEHMSEVLATIGEYDRALEHNYAAIALVIAVCTSADEIARRLADLCCKTAAIHEKKSSYNTAFNWLRGGLIAIEGIDAVEAARIYLLGAGVYQRQGNHEEAINWCQKSLSVAGQINTQEGQLTMGHAYYNLGGIYNRRGDLELSIQFCRQSLQVYEQIGDIVGQSHAHNNLGNAYFDRGGRGDWKQGTDHYLQALEIRRKIGDVYGQAMSALNLGQAFLDQGDLEQADSYFRESLEMWQELESAYAIALLHNNMGAVALRQNDPEKALELFQRSLDQFQEIGAGDFVPEVCRHMAEAWLVQDRLDEALEYAQRSLSQAREQEMLLEEGITRRVLGQVYLAQGNLELARQQLEQSHRILQELNSRYAIGKTLYQLCRFYRTQGDEHQANACLSQAQAIFADLGARLDEIQVQQLAAH